MKKAQPYRIGFLSEFQPDDRRASSGTAYSAFLALQEIGEVKWIPIKRRRGLYQTCRICRKVLQRLTGINIDYVHTHIGSRLTYHPIKTQEIEDCDIIIGFFCLHNIYNRRFDRPIIYISDAPICAMINYYPGFTGMPEWNIRQSIDMDKGVLRNVDKIVFSSEWASRAASPYGCDQKIEVVEFGANINSKIDFQRGYESDKPLELLFLGVDWERKGGELAVTATEWLNGNGVPARLHIVGIKKLPEQYSNHPYILQHGFLNKNNPADSEKLENIMRRADLLLLPTKAECSAIAFAEAAAFGLPVFTHLTGGTSSYVIDGVTGCLLPIGSSGKDFGISIRSALKNNQLTEMPRHAINLYHSRLNWGVWAKRISNLINNLIKN